MAAPLIPLVLALAQFAPSLMRYFGAGDSSTAVAEQVADIAQTVSGASTPQEALAAIRNSAELQQAFNLAVLSADTDLTKTFLADRQDARNRDIEVRKLTGGTNARADLMIVGAVIGILACLGTLTFFRKGEIPGEVVGIISTIAGLFGACLRDAFQFEFGSSRGSRDKDDLFAAQLRDSVKK